MKYISEQLEELDKLINELQTEQNMNKIIKLHKELNEMIQELETKLGEETKEINNMKLKPQELTEEKYDDYIKYITSLFNQDLENEQLEDLIKIYKKVSNKITSCENYLESKKLDIEYIK